MRIGIEYVVVMCSHGNNGIALLDQLCVSANLLAPNWMTQEVSGIIFVAKYGISNKVS